MKIKLILFLIGLTLAAPRISLSESKNQPQFNETGTLMEMQAVPCGFQERGFTGFGGLLATAGVEHVNSNDKLCQEYVLRTAYIQYRIRPVNEKEPVLLPVGEKAHFHIKGDHILLSMPEGDDKMREYRVVGMKPVAMDEGGGSRYAGAGATTEAARPISFRVNPTDSIPRLERRPVDVAAPLPAVQTGGRLPGSSSVPSREAMAQQSGGVSSSWVAAGPLTLAADRSRLALDRVQVMALVAGGVSGRRVAMLFDEREVSFSPDANYLANLRSAGATDELIKALNEASGASGREAPSVNDARTEQGLTRGAQLAHAHQFEQAQQEYQKALQVRPQDPGLQFALGYVLTRQGKWKEAAAEYKAIAASEPGDPAAHSNLGVALKQAGDLEGAIREYRRALALDPDSAAVHEDLAAALDEKGDLNGAVPELRSAVQERPLDARLHTELGAILQQQKDLDGAIREDRQAISLQDPCCQAQYNLATALELKGDLAGAVDGFRNVLNVEPDDAQAHAGLASALERRGESAQALAHYKMALLLAPQDPDIRAAQDALQQRVQTGAGDGSGR
ncbi:MAG TPA: tetratricopeptide repeat protein [Terriglobia bacterium]